MLIKNVSVLLGNELDFVSRTNIEIQNQKFKKIQQKIQSNIKDEFIDGEGLLAIPGFINAHTHIGDSIGKDVTINSSVDKRIHPVFGIKSKILKNTPQTNLANFMKNSCYSMLRKGITTFVDFREGGLDGVVLLKKILSEIPLRAIVLGRIEFYQKSNEIIKNISFPRDKIKDLTELLKQCDGLGISGANENSTSVLNYYSKTQKLRAIHSSETKQSTLKSKKTTRISETKRALSL